MIRKCVLSFILVFSATCANAQEVRVRSGEHDGFTRLVLQIPPKTGWTLTHEKDGARIDVELDGVTYNTNSVFSRLSENRLKSLSQEKPGTALEMEFGCACAASAFLFRDNMIVVDIAPGEPSLSVTQDLPPMVLLPDLQLDDESEIEETPDPVPSLQLNGRALEDQLMSRMLQGADREIVDLQLSDIGPRSTEKVAPGNILEDLPANVMVSSVLDELRGLEGLSLPQIETQPACISDTDLGFISWSDGRPFPEQIAELRTGLFLEFDHIDTERVEKLAQLYAYHGYGAEAVQTLELLANAPSNSAWIIAISNLVDGRPQSEPNPFQSLQRCEGDAALWALLTEGDLHPDAQLSSIEQSFARLPDHLRRSLGPELSEILVNAEELEAARRVLRSVDRIDADSQPKVTLAKADVAEAAGDKAESEVLLSEVIQASESDLETPLALARLVEKRWSDRGAITSEELELVAGFAIQLRRSEIGSVMAQSHAVALGLNQEFGPAIELIRAHPEDKDWAGATNRVMHLLSERADDVTFLRYALNLRSVSSDTLETETAIALSERLAELGFASQAYALANRQQDRIKRKDRARLRARAALLQGQPHRALLEIAEDDSDEAQLLRAWALADAADLSAAASLLRATGETDEADRLFWLAGQADDIKGTSSSKFGTLSELDQALAQPVSRSPGTPLSDAKTLLADSELARERIEELLTIAAAQ
ncbi:hypothetical protein [Roseibium sp. RKSG952]|uniref:hypothetical protein n=1 Tax=Roseibium sp. RKSG952 TaxID=2529384 RepID=UPI0012BCD6F0|nr:hypothetical protein [Roseibium sp. RKSG952]MTI01303.1 hypothetical protein [Roseibium sp. RKSG952]